MMPITEYRTTVLAPSGDGTVWSLPPSRTRESWQCRRTPGLGRPRAPAGGGPRPRVFRGTEFGVRPAAPAAAGPPGRTGVP
eukprot:72769-Hanusia_phi.AAC.4